jgi:hypothetical protein
LIVGNYYVLTLLVFIAATVCALVLARRVRPERAVVQSSQKAAGDATASG